MINASLQSAPPVKATRYHYNAGHGGFTRTILDSSSTGIDATMYDDGFNNKYTVQIPEDVTIPTPPADCIFNFSISDGLVLFNANSTFAGFTAPGLANPYFSYGTYIGNAFGASAKNIGMKEFLVKFTVRSSLMKYFIDTVTIYARSNIFAGFNPCNFKFDYYEIQGQED